MAIFKSGNPALNVFQNTISIPGEGTMTEQGTLNKFFLLFLLVMASASLTWKAFYDGVNIMPYVMGSAILGFIVALVVIFKKHGFKWGGDWISFKDLPHFEMTFGKTWQNLLALHNANKMDANGYVNIA